MRLLYTGIKIPDNKFNFFSLNNIVCKYGERMSCTYKTMPYA
jgi:hypothetical protein